MGPAKSKNPADLSLANSIEGVPLSTAAWPREDWWTSIKDPQLDGLMREALANSPDLAITDARTKTAAAEAQQVASRLYTGISASGGYTGVRAPSAILPAPFGGKYIAIEDLGLRLAYSPDLWGGNRAAWQAAVGRRRASEVDGQAARVTLSINVASQYALLGYAFEERDIAEAELKRSRMTLQLTRQRVNAGIDSETQLKQAESAEPAAQRQVQMAQLRIESARVCLAALLGAGPDRGLEILRPPTLAPATLALPNAMPAELLGRRPDLVAARWRVEAASQDVRSAKADFYPNINLSAAVGLLSMGADHLLQASSRFYQIAPAVSLPIFDGGRLRADLAGRNAEYDEAVAQYNQRLVDDLRDVVNAIVTLQSLNEQATTQQRALELSWASYSLAMQRFKSGVGNYIEALAVEQRLLADEQEVASVHLQQLDASVQLVQSLGGGFVEDADAAVPSVAANP